MIIFLRRQTVCSRRSLGTFSDKYFLVFSEYSLFLFCGDTPASSSATAAEAEAALPFS